MSNQTVPVGPYLGFTFAQLQAELSSLIAQRQSISSLIGASVNGQSFNRESSESQLRALSQRTEELHQALYLLRPDKYPYAPTNRAAIRFV
jgi:hypothetical protein